MIRVLIGFIFLLGTCVSSAVVDMKNASFTDVWVDLKLPGPSGELKIERAYKSRSQFDGMFGYGWCSDIETRIERMPEGSLKLIFCGAGATTLFRSKKSSTENLDLVIEKIVRKERRRRHGKSLQHLALQLRKNHNLRKHYAEIHSIHIPSSSRATFSPVNGESEYITYKNKTYSHYKRDKLQKFNSKGQLVYLGDRTGNFIKFQYRGKQLIRGTDRTGRQLNFRYLNSNGKIKKITGPQGVASSYKYDKNLLVSNTNAWGNTYHFRYNQFKLLSEVLYPDKTTKKIKYKGRTGQVTSFQNRDGCNETYKYLRSGNESLAQIEKRCNKALSSKKLFKYIYSTNSKGRKFLSKEIVDDGFSRRQRKFHPHFSRPIFEAKGSQITRTTLSKNGNIKTTKTNDTSTLYEYNKRFNKISRVTLKSGSKTTILNFNYDKKGRLKSARSSRGPAADLSYDYLGRVTSIRDQKKRKVKIKYHPSFGRPAIIEQVGVGKIKVLYDSYGNMTRVRSKNGPKISIEVSRTLNQLMEILIPSKEIKLK